MLTVLPLKDTQRKTELLKSVPKASDNAAVLVMANGEEELAWVVVDIHSSIVRMLKMQVGEKEEPLDITNSEVSMCVDTLMRAAAYYGANNGAYRIFSAVKGIENYLQGLGFQIHADGLVVDLKEIVRFCSPS